jgi:hypothetical protein
MFSLIVFIALSPSPADRGNDTGKQSQATVRASWSS